MSHITSMQSLNIPTHTTAAILCNALAVNTSGQAQLLPSGSFSARDGRPGPGKRWRLSDEQGRSLAARVNGIASQTPIVIDYEHQTMHAATNGKDAPAAGWITRTEWQPGKGLFASVDWTARAKASIDAKEYRFISPVITSDAKTGEVTGLLLAALVNYPALVGMEPVLAACAATFGAASPGAAEWPSEQAQHIATMLGVSAEHFAASSALSARPAAAVDMRREQEQVLHLFGLTPEQFAAAGKGTDR